MVENMRYDKDVCGQKLNIQGTRRADSEYILGLVAILRERMLSILNSWLHTP